MALAGVLAIKRWPHSRDEVQASMARTRAIKKPRRDFLIKLLIQNHTKD